MPDDKEVARRRMALCTRRSDEAGDPPCWQALPEDYAARDCEAGCLRDASATVENGSPMPDDAIERARRSGFNAGIDHIANFINALDSEGMTGRDVRSAIYSECLEARPPAMLDAAPSVTSPPANQSR